MPSWYRRIDIRMWGDQRFRALSSPNPNAQTLWIYLLTGPHTEAIPGLSIAGEAMLAEALGWNLKAFREAFREVFAKGLAEADWTARVVWIQNAIKYNPPESPNVVKSWGKLFDRVPECNLKAKAWYQLKAFTEGLGEGFREAFREGFGEGYAESPSPSPSPTLSPTEEETVPSGGPTEPPGPDGKIKAWEDWDARLSADLAQTPGYGIAVWYHYRAGLVDALAAFYSNRGGRLTDTRRAYVANQLGRFPVEAQVYAIEFFVDRHAGDKDERYLVGIARRLSRMSPEEQDRELNNHRQRYEGRGLWAGRPQ